MAAYPHRDLRDWLDRVDVQRVEGADADLEIGAVTDLWGSERPALLFDRIPGYPDGFRVLTRSLTSVQRLALTLGLTGVRSKLDLVRAVRDILGSRPPLAPEFVAATAATAPVLTHRADDLTRFPAPRFHEGDGGRFIGTGCLVMLRDPDTGWVNVGTYRVQVHGPQEAGLFMVAGKHGDRILRRYHEQGRACPVAVSCGHDPLLFLFAGIEVGEQVCEFDVAGGIRGEPVRLVQGPVSGVPFPADAEIVLEGQIPPDELRPEGPFAEWAGYYAGGVTAKPVIRVQAIWHRDDPIILAAPPGMPPSDNTYFLSPIKAAGLWDDLQRTGISGLRGVWMHEVGGGRLMIILSLQALYPGHSNQALLAAAGSRQGAYANRLIVAVDDDIDPTDTDQVLWALCTRCDVDRAITRLQDCWTSPVDPMHYPSQEDGAVMASRLLIDACRPWERRHSFPVPVQPSPQLVERVRARFSGLFEA